MGLVVVGVINYCWWLWQSSGCGGGDSLCKGYSCNSCKRAQACVQCVVKFMIKVGVVVEVAVVVVVVGFMFVVVGVVSMGRTTKTYTTNTTTKHALN